MYLTILGTYFTANIVNIIIFSAYICSAIYSGESDPNLVEFGDNMAALIHNWFSHNDPSQIIIPLEWKPIPPGSDPHLYQDITWNNRNTTQFFNCQYQNWVVHYNHSVPKELGLPWFKIEGDPVSPLDVLISIKDKFVQFDTNRLSLGSVFKESTVYNSIGKNISLDVIFKNLQEYNPELLREMKIYSSTYRIEFGQLLFDRVISETDHYEHLARAEITFRAHNPAPINELRFVTSIRALMCVDYLNATDEIKPQILEHVKFLVRTTSPNWGSRNV